jgi:SRSO17 transposase
MQKITSGDALLLEDCVVTASSLEPLLKNLAVFASRYGPHFRRREQRDLFQMYIEGLLSGLERKSIEPIATDHDEPRRALQRFVGAGLWDDDPVLAELRTHVREELGSEDGVLIIDPSSFPKKGTESVGVKRQWCGRLGKEDNCQVGVYLSYVSPKGHTLVDHALYLPREWAESTERRQKCHVPSDATYRSTWQIADDLLVAHGSELPHRWVVGDEEFGHIGPFRETLRQRSERYLLAIPQNILIQDLVAPPPPKAKTGRPRKGLPYIRVDKWAEQLPANRWRRILVRDGEKEPIELHAVSIVVHARKQSTIERLLVTRTPGPKPEYHFWISNDHEAALDELVRVSAERHRIEEDLERAKGEVGLDHYEVRSWVGWHHHMTLALLALFFLVLEQRRVGGKKLRDNGPAGLVGASGIPA